MTDAEATLLADAIWLAMEHHYAQRRKYTGEPYVVHPLRVMLALVDAQRCSMTRRRTPN